MHRHHGLQPSPAPAAVFVEPRKPIGLIGLLVAALFIGACSTGSGAAAGAGEPDSMEESPDQGLAHTDEAGPLGAGDEHDSSGRFTFRNPESDGFAPVIDNDSVPVEGGEEPADGPKPGAVIPEIAAQLKGLQSTEGVLDAIEALDGATDVATDRDGLPRNGSGEPLTLDEEASLACAHAEIAIGQLDSGQVSVALERVATTAHHAGRSSLAAVKQWVEPLATVVVDGKVADLSPLVGFLSACTEGGYEL